MVETIDYSSMAGIAAAISGLTEAIRYAVGKMSADKNQQESDALKAAINDTLSNLRISDVKVEGKLASLERAIEAVARAQAKLEDRMETRDEQVRQGLNDAMKALNDFAIQAAKSGG